MDTQNWYDTYDGMRTELDVLMGSLRRSYDYAMNKDKQQKTFSPRSKSHDFVPINRASYVSELEDITYSPPPDESDDFLEQVIDEHCVEFNVDDYEWNGEEEEEIEYDDDRIITLIENNRKLLAQFRPDDRSARIQDILDENKRICDEIQNEKEGEEEDC